MSSPGRTECADAVLLRQGRVPPRMGHQLGSQDPPGRSAQVAAPIRRCATTYGYAGAERPGAGECARCMSNKKGYLGYDTALDE